MLFSITFLANLIALAGGIWLGLYLISRNPRRPVAWLAGLTLWSLSAHYLNVLLALSTSPSPETPTRWMAGLLHFWGGSAPDRASVWLQGWMMIPAVVFWHHATSLMHTPRLGRWRRAGIALAYGGALLAVVLQAGWALLLAAAPGGDPLYLSALAAGPLYGAALAGGLLLVAIIVLNLAGCVRTAAPILRSQFRMMIMATLLAVSVVLISVAASSAGLRVPTVVTAVPLGASMLAMAHGVARYSAFVEGRAARREFVYAAATGALTLILYLTLAALGIRYLGAPPIVYVIVAVVVVPTHFLVDAARYRRDAAYYRRDMHRIQAGLHKLAGLAGDRETLDRQLSIALDSLCASAEAIWGLVLVFEDGDARVAAARGWPAGPPRVPRQDVAADDVLYLKPGQLPPPLAEAALLLPLYGEAEQLGALILGRPAHGVSYSPDDVDEFLYVSDRLGAVIQDARRRAEYAAQVTQGTDVLPPEAPRDPGQVTVQAVEDALRHMTNYGYLGGHSLACLHGVHARLPGGTVTHLDVGKAMYALLADGIEKLRPGPAPTTDPPQREWYAYLILHDAYLEGISNRDIMSRLYISQGTFSRTRRGALRDLARALEEMETTT